MVDTRLFENFFCNDKIVVANVVLVRLESYAELMVKPNFKIEVTLVFVLLNFERLHISVFGCNFLKGLFSALLGKSFGCFCFHFKL